MFIYGKEPILSLIAAATKQKICPLQSIHVHVKRTKNHIGTDPIATVAKDAGCRISYIENESHWEQLFANERFSKDHVHQGVCAVIPDGLWALPLSTAIDSVKTAASALADSGKKENRCVGIVLDQIQDPQNFGSIVRTAAFFGVSFVAYTEQRQSAVTSTVIKVSAGGIFGTQMVSIPNVNQALELFKKSGAWVVGGSLNPKAVGLQHIPHDGRCWVLVVGNEGDGLRPHTEKLCDYLVQIPGIGSQSVDSLNVGVATGVLVSHLFL